MKNKIALTVLKVLSGFVFGVVLTGIVIWSIAPSMMMIENQSNLNFEETITQIQSNAADQGWSVPNTLRLNKSLEKDGYSVLPVAVIELCKPDIAAKVLSDDEARLVSSLMPCRVAIYEKSNGEVIISRMNTGLISKMFGGLITDAMREATAQTEKILDPLEKPEE